MSCPRLETPRLILREWRETDLDALARMHADPEIVRFLGGTPRSRAESWANMATYAGQWALRGTGLWAVEHRPDGRFAGRVGILHPESRPEPELAYSIGRAFWGQGLAEEACRAALAWYRTRGAPPPVSYIDPVNHRSRRLAARLGAYPETTIELHGKHLEQWRHALDAATPPP